jgi:hypothetical protein
MTKQKLSKVSTGAQEDETNVHDRSNDRGTIALYYVLVISLSWYPCMPVKILGW